MKKMMTKAFKILSRNSAKIITEKKSIRKKVRETKGHISEIQKQSDADSVFSKIESLPEFQSAKTILMYWSRPDELPTHTIVEKWSCEKVILLPSVHGDDITIKHYDTNQKMTKGKLGIWEPDTSDIFTGNIDLVIVPGVAFDLNKNRLGRGKGYYDRFFDHIKTLKWGVCFDYQLFNSIPINNQDVKMDKIISPNKII